MASAEVGAGPGRRVRAIAAAVVGQHAFDGDAVIGEPGHGPAQDTDRGDGLLIGADFDLGDAGVVVDHRVKVGRARAGISVLAAKSRALSSLDHVPVALLASNEPVPSDVWDVAELR